MILIILFFSFINLNFQELIIIYVLKRINTYAAKKESKKQDWKIQIKTNLKRNLK